MAKENTISAIAIEVTLIQSDQDFKQVEFDQFKTEAGTNLESLNAHLIGQEISQAERLTLLNNTAIYQMRLLTENKTIKQLEGKRQWMS